MVFRRLPSTPSDHNIPENLWVEFLEIYKQFQDVIDAIKQLEETAGGGGGVSGNHVILPGPNGTTQHETIPQGEVHVPQHWTVSTQDALASLPVTSLDLYKIARVSSTNKYYTLINTAPKTWRVWNGEPSTSPQIPSLLPSDVFLVYRGGQEYTLDFCRIIAVDRLELTFADSPYACAECSQILEVDDTGGNVDIIFPENLRDDPLEVEVVKMEETANMITLDGNGRAVFPANMISYKGTAIRFRSSVDKWIAG